MTAPSTPSEDGPLGDRAFRSVYIGIVLTMLGAWMSNTACAWLMSRIDRSAVMLGWLQASFMAPVVILSLPIGVLADTLNRRHTAIAGCLLMAAACASLAGFCAAGRMGAGSLLAHTLIMGAVTALLGPLVMAIIQDIVRREQLAQAVTLYSVALNGGRAVGPAAAGVLIGLAGVAAAFVVNGFAYAAFAVSLWRWRAPPQASVVEKGWGAALIGGLRYAALDRAFRALLLRLLFFLVCASGLLAVAPIVAAARLGGSPSDFGALTGAIGAGALAGALGRAFVAARWPRIVGADVCAVAVAASYAGLALCHGFAPVIGFAALFGVGWTNAAIGFQSRAQLSLPAPLRGRGGAIYLTVFALGTLLGGLIAGAVLDHLPLGASLLLAGGLLGLDPLTVHSAQTWRQYNANGAAL
jgi:predicted MFS family arabinose efflux permease